MALTLIGDVHAKWYLLAKLLHLCNKEDVIIQVGDFGIGFGYNIDKDLLPKNFKFFPGNHDKKTECQEYSNYMGAFGYDESIKAFFVGGAFSIDKYRRTEDVSWWSNEELNYTEAEQCLELYSNIKPDLVLSHDCPFVQRKLLLNHVSDESNRSSFTVKLLDEMLEIHQPKVWVHGHLHIQETNKIGNTLFIGLKELGMVRLDDALEVLNGK